MRAVIIGAGIGGLAAGIALRSAGWDVTVCERAQQLRSSGTGLIIWNAALKALYELGLKEQFERCSFVSDASLFDFNGRMLMNGRNLPHSMRHMHVVHRSELLTMLSEALGPDSIKFGAACTSYQQNTNSVRASFANGDTIEADLLVAADGLHSSLRHKIATNDKPIYAGYTAWRAVLQSDHNKITPGEFWGPNGRFGYMPMTENRILWFASLNAAEGAHYPEGERLGLLRALQDWHPSISEVIRNTDETAIIRNDVYDLTPINRWVNGRAILLGDSAHAMSPVLGQGACQALEDGVVLGLCLKKYASIEQALKRYETERTQRANFFVRYARVIGKMGQLRSPFFSQLRNNAVLRFGGSGASPDMLERFNDLDLESLRA